MCDLVTDRGLASLPALPILEQLDLPGPGVSDGCDQELRRRYPGARVERQVAMGRPAR